MSRDIEAYVREIVAKAPPLTDAQRDTLAAIFRTNRLEPLPPPPSAPPKPPPRVALYRHYDRDGVLLYVGISSNVVARGKSHAKAANWARWVADSQAEWFDTRQEAEVAERAAIKAERPLFNTTHSTVPDEERVQYLVAHEAWAMLAPRKSDR